MKKLLLLLCLLAANPAYGSTVLGASTTITSPNISGDNTTGFYTAGAGLLDTSISGVKTVEWSSTGEKLYSGSLSINGSSSGTVTITPAAAAGTWTMTLPTTAGTSGYLLSTDGSGVASWVARGAGGRVITSGTTDTATTADSVIFWNNTSSLTTTRTETLYAGTTINQSLKIVDEAGSWGQGNLKVTPNGAQTINGASSFLCNQNFNSAELHYDGTSNWHATCR